MAYSTEGGRLHGEEQCTELEGNNGDGLYWPRLALQCGEGPEHTKATMIRTEDYKYVKRLYEKDELDNQIENIYYSEALLSLKEKMSEFYQETSDTVPQKIDKRDFA